MSEVIETIQLFEGQRVEIYYDSYEDGEWIIPEWSEIVTDVHYFKKSTSLRNTEAWDKNDGTYKGMEKLMNDLKKEFNAFYVSPICKYEHSGISLWAGYPNCRFDSGIIGFGCINSQRALKAFNIKSLNQHTKKKIIDIFEESISMFGEYLNGETYRYCQYDQDNNVIDDCGGYIGYKGYQEIVSLFNEVTTNYEMSNIKSIEENIKTFLASKPSIQRHRALEILERSNAPAPFMPCSWLHYINRLAYKGELNTSKNKRRYKINGFECTKTAYDYANFLKGE